MNGRSLVRAITVDVLDESGGSEWNRLVLSHPNCSVFHSAEWARVIHQTYGHKAIYLYFSGEGEPVALVPLIEVLSPFTGRRGVCLPFSDACEPLVFRKNTLSVVTDELSRLARERGWKYFEIRGGEPLQDSADAASAFYGHKLDLPANSEQLFDRFTNSTKGAVRQALRGGLNVEITETSDAVGEFYKLHGRTRKRHGIPPQPTAFFSNIHDKLIRSGLGFVVLARMGMRVVAGAIFLRLGRKAVYKFAASDPKFGRSRANNLVMWEAIRYLVGTGCDLLDFGRTALDNEGLRRFKLSWGADEKMIRYYRFDANQQQWITASSRETGLHNRLFRNLPLGVNRMAGAMLYPHLD